MALDAIETALMLSPTLGLLDVTENNGFARSSYSETENKGIAKRSSYSEIGTLEKDLWHTCKKLDLVAVGWPACLHIVASGQGRR